MVFTKDALYSETRANMRGGDGEAVVTTLLPTAEMNGKGRMFSRITLPPGASIGEHTHENDAETYYFLRGKAEYSDNGHIVTVGAGDVTHVPAGQHHGVRNVGDEPVELVALILYA